jgi:Tol biopolymer transport system component/mono/diheme cytochrome c family protein
MKRRACPALLGLLLGAALSPAPILARGAPDRGTLRIGPDIGLGLARDDLPRSLLGLLLLGVAIGLVPVALRFLPSTSLARVLTLGCAPAAVLAGGYLLFTANAAGGKVAPRTTPVALTNPLAADPGSPERGRALFATNCVACHGARGRGDGPLAPTLIPRPANLADAHMVGHRDTDLFGFISNGIPGSAMAAWQNQLTERDRWDLVNYVRTFAPVAVAPTGVPGLASLAVGTRPPARLAADPVPNTLAGRLIYASEGRLWSLNVATGSPVELVPGRSRDTLAAEPALSPDGLTLAFTLLPLPAPGSTGAVTSAPGTDIYLLTLRDGVQHQVLAHDQPGTLIEALNWTPDGRALIYAFSTPLLTATGQLTGTHHEVQRLDLTTGQRTTLIADALSPNLSPDGTALAYVASNPQTFETSLWLANADGSGRRQLVGTQGGFSDFLAPRFSPDGAQIAFSVAGGPGVEQPQPSPPTSGAPQRLLRWLSAPLAPQSAAAHGLPGDLWLVGRDGQGVQRLTALYEDQPIPAWSSDGQWVAILGGGGIYFVRADGTTLVRRSKVGGAGALIWTGAEAGPAIPTRGP